MCVHDIDTCILEKYHKVVSIFNRIDEKSLYKRRIFIWVDKYVNIEKVLNIIL